MSNRSSKQQSITQNTQTSSIHTSDRIKHWTEKLQLPHLNEVQSRIAAALAIGDNDQVQDLREHLFMLGVVHEDISLMEKALANGMSVNFLGNGQLTPAHVACSNGNLDVVAFLIENGANLSVKSGIGQTPLHLAVLNDHLDVVKVLTEIGINLEDKDKEECTALHWASDKGHTHIVEFLLESGANLEENMNYGRTAIHAASSNGHLDTVQFLLEKGAHLEKESTKRWTPLHEASFSGHTELVSFLVDRGANLHRKTATGWTPLHEASSAGHTEAVKFLLEQGAHLEGATNLGWTPLLNASTNGHTETVELLLDHGCDIRAKTSKGLTALHQACKSGHIGTARLLIDRGAHLERIDSNWTALHEASFYGHTDVVRLLLSRGADLHAKTQRGTTALHEASWKGQTETVRLLLDQGAALDAKARETGQTPVLAASAGGHTETVQLLLERGAQLEGRSERGETALHMACYFGQIGTAQFLLETQGADIHAKTGKGETGLHRASARGHTDTVLLLIDKGAKLDERDARGSTALDIALDMKHAATAQVIARFTPCESCEFLADLERRRQTLAHSLVMSRTGSINAAKRFVQTASDLSVDAFNRSPVQLAIETGNEEILEHFLQLDPHVQSHCGDLSDLLRMAILNYNRKATNILLDATGTITWEAMIRPGKDKLNALFIAKLRGLDDVVEKMLAKVPRKHLSIYYKCFLPGKEASDGQNEPLAPLERLNQRFPLFLEKVNPSWKPELRMQKFSYHEKIKPEVAKTCCHLGHGREGKVDEIIQTCFSPGLAQIESRTVAHRLDTCDDSCRMAHDLILASYIIQEQLRRHDEFGALKPSFSLIGSVIEGTRLGPASEIDITLLFKAFEKDFFAGDKRAFNLKLSHKGVDFLKQNKLELFMDQDSNLCYTTVFKALLLALEHALDRVKLPSRLQIVTKNKNYRGLRCEQCKRTTQQKNKSSTSLSPAYHCEKCLPVITFTKLGPCLIFQWRKDEKAKPITATVDLIPVFSHPASAEELFAQMVDTLISERPAGWEETLVKYLSRDRIIAEAAALDAAYQSSLKNKPDSPSKDTLIAMKIQHFKGNSTFMIRPGQDLDFSVFDDETARSVYIALKGIRTMMKVDVKSYFLKKVLLKRQIRDFVKQVAPNELQLFYEVLTQPELKPLFQEKVDMELLKGGLFTHNKTSININRKHLQWEEEE